MKFAVAILAALALAPAALGATSARWTFLQGNDAAQSLVSLGSTPYQCVGLGTAQLQSVKLNSAVGTGSIKAKTYKAFSCITYTTGKGYQRITLVPTGTTTFKHTAPVVESASAYATFETTYMTQKRIG